MRLRWGMTEFIHLLVDLLATRTAFVQFEHPLHERDQLSVPSCVGWHGSM